MGFESRKKVRLANGRDVWQYTFVRYRDAASGKFISKEELGEDPLVGIGKMPAPDLGQIEELVLSTLIEVAADHELAGKSTASMKMLIDMVDRMKQEAAENQEEEWFILGRQLAKEVLELLEEDPARQY